MIHDRHCELNSTNLSKCLCDMRNERVALVADGCNISYEEAEKMVDKWIKEKNEILQK